MEKIPTLFVRDPLDRRYVTAEVNPGCEWVLDGEGVSTRKYDGTCLLYDPDDGGWWARREVKPGKSEPPNFRPVAHDENTGKTMGWEPVSQSSFHGAFSTIPASMRPTEPGTYELIGPKVNGNPENAETHRLVPHGRDHLGPSVRTYDEIRKYLTACVPPVEGFVYHHPDGRMVKIKRRDFPMTEQGPKKRVRDAYLGLWVNQSARDKLDSMAKERGVTRSEMARTIFGAGIAALGGISR